MARLGMIILSAGIALLAGCASSTVGQPESTPLADVMSRPERVVVYDFVGTGEDLTAGLGDCALLRAADHSPDPG